jgi:hypothetical protein
MSHITSSYKDSRLQDLRKDYALSIFQKKEPEPLSPVQVIYQEQKIVIIIDLTPSIYSYHSGLGDIIYNSIKPTLSTLIKGLYASSINLEVSVICTRMIQSPLRAIIQSYPIDKQESYHELLYLIKTGLENLFFAEEVHKEDFRYIKFNTVLKWSLFSLQMMSKNSLPMVILLTNTVDSYVCSAIYDGLVTQYCRNDVALHVISLCSPDKLRLGLSSDHLALKDASKATGGHFLNSESLKSSLESLFARTLYRKKAFTNKFFIEEYVTSLSIEDLLLCRLREGFVITHVSASIGLILFCGKKTKIEYTIKKYEVYCSVQIHLITQIHVYNKIKEKLKHTLVNIKGNEPTFHERVSWIIHNLKETENFLVTINNCIIKNDFKKEDILNKNINVWHKWFDIERLDVVVCKTSSETMIYQGKKKFNDVLKKFCDSYENDCFLDLKNNSMMIGKVVWEGSNKAIVYFGFYRTYFLQKSSELYETLKKVAGIEVYNKALGKMLVENLYTSKGYSISSIQSAQSYKPQTEALKSYMLRRKKVYKLPSCNWTNNLMSLIYESKVKKGFYYLGNCNYNKLLLYKPCELKVNAHNKTFFFQYLFYITKNEVTIEFYIDPELINKEEVWEEIYDSLEATDEFLYRSFYALEFLVFKCIRHKLQDEDYNQEEDFDEKIVKMSENDDFYCYIVLDSAKSFKKAKKDFIRSLLKILDCYIELPIENPSISLLLKHSVVYTHEFEVFKVLPTNKYCSNICGKLYKNILSAFSEICDFSKTEDRIHYYIRYITENSILIWKLQGLEDITSNITSNNVIPINFYECRLGKLEPTNREPIKSKGEIINNETLIRNITLIKLVYKSVVKYTYCEVFDDLDFDIRGFMVLINSCDIETKPINVSGIHSLIYPEWNDIEKLVKNLCDTSIYLLGDAFAEMDKIFLEYIFKQFYKIPETNYYIFKDKLQGIFLRFGDGSSKLSHCLSSKEFCIDFYTFPRNKFFRREINGYKNKKCTDSSVLLKSICETAVSLLSKQALYLLAENCPVTEKSIEKVLHHLNLVPEKVEKTVLMNLNVSTQNFTDLIHSELMKNKILYTRCIKDLYFLVNTATEYNFSLSDHHKNTYKSYTGEYYIYFWAILEVIYPNSIKFIYYLPNTSEFSHLSSEIVKAKLIKKIEELEIRVNQKMLLKNLLETGKISPKLLPEVPINLQEDKKTEDTRKKQSPKTERSYRLQLQHTHEFLTNKVYETEASNALSLKFGIPPFIIHNKDDTYMIAQNQNLWLFQFEYIEDPSKIVLKKQSQPTPDPKKQSQSKPEQRKEVDLKSVRLKIFGINYPPEDMISKLEKIIADILQKISLAKLADSLIKNQKKVMLNADYEFITNANPSELIFYPIPSTVTDFDLLVSITKQNLLRFLSPFKMNESTVLVYNYLTIIENTPSKNTDNPPNKNNKNLMPKHYAANNSYLGNTFGKALALISFETVYYDGENACVVQSKKGNFESKYTKHQIICDTTALQKYSGRLQLCCVGLYLQVKICKNGDFYSSAFKDQLDSCISESILEYMLEKILTIKDFGHLSERYIYISEFAMTAISSSLKNPSLEILHCSNWNNLLLFYSQIIKITQKQLGNKKDKSDKIKFRCGISKENDYLISDVLEEIEERWSSLKSEENIGKVLLTAMAGPDSISEITDSNLKVYLSEQMGEVYIKRSVFIYIEVNERCIKFFTYNLHKNALTNIQKSVEEHIHWTRERYLRLNSCLMQKLGLFYHTLNLSSTPSSIKEEGLSAMLPKVCSSLEIKESTKKYSTDSVIKTAEISHTDGSFDNNVLDFKLKGAYPLIRYGMSRFDDWDLVKRHVLYMDTFLDKKREHADEYQNCACAYIRWATRKNTPMDRMISKISKGAKIRNEKFLVKEILKSCNMFYKENVKYYMQASGGSKNCKLDYMLCELLKLYSEKLAKITKFDSFIQTDIKNPRKKSVEDMESPLKFVTNFFSSGSFKTDQKAEKKLNLMQSFIKKAYERSLIIIEICYENNIISTIGYCIEDFYKCFPMHRSEEMKLDHTFLKEMSRIKLYMDSVSNLYDIHVKCISNYLSNSKTYSEIDLVKTLNIIVTDFKKPPRKSINSIYSFSMYINFREDYDIIVEDLFLFFIFNCQERGYYQLMLGTKSQCAYKKFSDNENVPVHQANGYIRWCVYTLGNKKNIQQLNDLVVKCFIITHDEFRKSCNDSIKKIKNNIQKDFEKTMMELKDSYEGHKLWGKVIESSTNFSYNDFKLLVGASKVLPMHDIDPRIKYLCSFKNVFTLKCIDYLQEVYNRNSKIFEIDKKIHFVVFFSKKNIAQLILSPEDQNLEMLFIRVSFGSNTKEEDDFITDLINKILQWLWLRISSI